MPHEISAAAASRDRHRERKRGPDGPSELLHRVLAVRALGGSQKPPSEGGQNGQLELGDASSDSVPRGINRGPLEAHGESL